jgi:iturin family lipopeptide synthetase A/iturin family lipopeptide synthetase C/tyrocidine synthetase-3
MIPSRFVLLDKLPLTSNGKVDRRALPPPASDDPAPAPAVARPLTETETALVAIWTELLDVQNIGVNDDFFDLGGHSLLAIRTVSRIRDVFGVDLHLRSLFERPTVAALAEAVDALAWSANAKVASGRAGDREEIEL